MAPGRHTNGAPWPILMAHPWCAISIPDTNGAPGGAPLVKITNGVLLMAHHRCAINGHIRCAISRGFSSSEPDEGCPTCRRNKVELFLALLSILQDLFICTHNFGEIVL